MLQKKHFFFGTPQNMKIAQRTQAMEIHVVSCHENLLVAAGKELNGLILRVSTNSLQQLQNE